MLRKKYLFTICIAFSAHTSLTGLEPWYAGLREKGSSSGGNLNKVHVGQGVPEVRGGRAWRALVVRDCGKRFQRVTEDVKA